MPRTNEWRDMTEEEIAALAERVGSAFPISASCEHARPGAITLLTKFLIDVHRIAEASRRIDARGVPLRL